MKKVLMSFILFLLAICISQKNDINTYQINNKIYYEENQSEIEETVVKELYKINISSSGTPSSSISDNTDWTLDNSVFGFRISLVKTNGAQIGDSIDYASNNASSEINKIKYNSSSRKSKTYIINNNIDVKFNGNLSNLNSFHKLPDNVTGIDDLDEYFKKIIYVEDEYSDTKIKTYVKNTFNQDLSNSCLNDYYLLIEPLVMIKSNSLSMSLIEYYFGTPTELAYLMKEKSSVNFNVDEIAHYMYYDNKKTEFLGFVLSPVTSSVAGLNDILSKTGYGTAVAWLGSSKNECGTSDNYYCIDVTTEEQISIRDCIDYTMQDRPVVNYSKKYQKCGTGYYPTPNENGICIGKDEKKPKCTEGSFVIENGKGYCKIEKPGLLQHNSNCKISSNKKYCRYTDTPICKDGYKWVSSVNGCRKIDNSYRTCSSGSYNGSSCTLVNYNNCVSWNQKCYYVETSSYLLPNNEAYKCKGKIDNTNKICNGKSYSSINMSCCRFYKYTCENTSCAQYEVYNSTSPLTCNGLNNSTIKKEGDNCALYNYTTTGIGAITCKKKQYKYSKGKCYFNDATTSSFSCKKGVLEKKNKNSAATCYVYIDNSKTLKCDEGYHLTDNNKNCVKDNKKANWTLSCPSGYEWHPQSYTSRCKDNYLTTNGSSGSEKGCCSRNVSENEAIRICSSEKCSGIKKCGIGMNEENYDDSTATKKDITECFKANVVTGYSANTSLKLCEVENCYSSCSKLSDYGKLSKRNDNNYQKCLIEQLKNQKIVSNDSDIGLDDESEVDFGVIDQYCKQSYCKNNCFDISLTRDTLNQSLKCTKTDMNNDFKFDEDVIQISEDNCELGSTRKYGRHLKRIGNCDIYCVENAIASLPGNISKKMSKGTYFEWPTEGGQYPLSITIISKCHIVVNDGTTANNECKSHRFTPDDFFNVMTSPIINIDAGKTINEEESVHKYIGNLKVISDTKRIDFNGYVTTDKEVNAIRTIRYKLDDNVNRYYNRINDTVSSIKRNGDFDRKIGNISTSIRDEEGIYNLKLNFVSGFGTDNIFGKKINNSDYTCNYEIASSLTVVGICKCPSGTKNYNKELPFSCSDVSCSELQAKYCDSDLTIPVCENTCKGDCEWIYDDEKNDQLNIKKKYCDGNSSYCEMEFICPSDKVMSGDAKTCVLTKLRNNGYIKNNNISLENIDDSELESVLKECMPIVCSDNLDQKIVFRIIDLNNPFPGKTSNGTTNKFSNSNLLGRYPGSNWDITYVKNKILNGRNKKGNEIYKADPLYTIKLTPSLIKTIRDYNKKNNYDNFDLKCLNSEDESACISKLLHNEISEYKTTGLLTKNLNNKTGKCNSINSSSTIKKFNECYAN